MKKFHYCAYWGTWSRMLGRRPDHNFYTVELDLTPVNGDSGNWARVRDIWIRAHCTSPGKNDEDTNRLPIEIWKWLGTRLGNEVRHMLVTHDFLPLIDWERYDARCNGGCAFQECAKVSAPQSTEDVA